MRLKFKSKPLKTEFSSNFSTFPLNFLLMKSIKMKQVVSYKSLNIFIK